MSNRRENNRELFERIHDLVTARINDEMTPEQFAQLDALIGDNAEARRLYVRYLYETLALPELLGTDEEESGRELMSDDFPLADSPSPLPSHLPPSFVGGPVFSYLVATVVLCLMLLGAWGYKITHDGNLTADNSRRSTTHGQSELVFVGRITGMKDCQWSDSNTQTVVGASVPLDRKYALASGLLEITYQSGARVILEGPCKYKVESPDGGFLTQGKLTARIEGRREKREERREIEAASSQSLIPHPSSLFSVRTPTAVITDLGTEFGVEVAENGDTTSFVFEGKIVVQAGVRGFGDSGVRDSDKRPATAVAGVDKRELEAGDSIHVSMVRETHQGEKPQEQVRFTHPKSPPKFVRRIYEPPQVIDLLDIVAGGDGTGRRRERGIDPSTGKQDTFFMPTQYRFENRYHLVDWSRLIDGVCIPDGRSEPVVLDSAGHTFGDFGELTEGLTIGPIWARAADVSSINQKRSRHAYIYTMGQDDEFMPEARGLLGFHTNKGITFNLQAMREAHKGIRPSVFKAVTGMADASVAYTDRLGKADVWIFVDGRLTWKRRLHQGEKPVLVEVELSPDAQFLTILGTNAGDGSSGDWLVFGDPVLEITSPESKNEKEDRPMEQ